MSSITFGIGEAKRVPFGRKAATHLLTETFILGLTQLSDFG